LVLRSQEGKIRLIGRLFFTFVKIFAWHG